MEVFSASVGELGSSGSKTAMKGGRRGKRQRGTDGDVAGGADDGGRLKKKTKTYDTSGSKLVLRSHTAATRADEDGEEGTSAMESQKRKMKTDADSPFSLGANKYKMVKLEPEAEPLRGEMDNTYMLPNNKTSSQSVTIEDIGNEEEGGRGGLPSDNDKYRDPLADETSGSGSGEGDGETGNETDNEDQSLEDTGEEDSNDEDNWKNDYPDDADNAGAGSGDSDQDSNRSSAGDSDDEREYDSDNGKHFNRKLVTDQDIAACSSKLGKMLKNFHKENGGPHHVSPATRRKGHHRSFDPYDDDSGSDEELEHFGRKKSSFLDDGLADEVVSSPADSG